MLTVADYELIRRKHFVDGQSGRAIAAELGHSRKTVAKAIANAVPAAYCDPLWHHPSVRAASKVLSFSRNQAFITAERSPIRPSV